MAGSGLGTEFSLTLRLQGALLRGRRLAHFELGVVWEATSQWCENHAEEEGEEEKAEGLGSSCHDGA